MNRQGVSVAAFPPVLEPCSQCKELLEVVELWKQAFRKSASHFLNVQRELIKAEAAAHRLKEIVSDQYRLDGEWDASQRHSSKRRKGRSESGYEEPKELQQMLLASLTAASQLCKTGAFNCFETRKQPSIRRKDTVDSPKPTKRHSWNEDSCQKDSTDGGVAGDVKEQVQKGFKMNGSEQHSTMVNTYDVPRIISHPSPIGPHLSPDGLHPSSDRRNPFSDRPRPVSVVESVSGSRIRSSSYTSDGGQSDHSFLVQRLQQLEGDKNRLQDQLEKQHLENMKVRQSLGETLNNLENHEIQLALAMQDLMVATSEIKKAAKIREQLNQLERERDQLLQKMEKVSDESSCVKSSLVQLLQEKSASNRHLHTENLHLRGLLQRQESGGALPRLASDSSATEDSLTLSFTLQPSTNGDTAAMMSAMDMTDLPVHKVGYLTKEGGRVKSWKKRLFVLNSLGLYYYKADDPAGCIKLSEISNVEQCRGKSSTHPSMFAIATQQRTYFAGASSQEEMQSWIGMLESLRQHHQQQSSPVSLLQATPTDSPTAVRSAPQNRPLQLGGVEDFSHSPYQKRPQKKGSPLKRLSDAPQHGPLVSQGPSSGTRPFSVITTSSSEPLSPSEIPPNTTEVPLNSDNIPPNSDNAPANASKVSSRTTGVPSNTTEVPPNTREVHKAASKVPLPGPGQRQSVSEDSRSSAAFSTDDATDSSGAHGQSTPV